ncbi:MAG: VanZ family protein [Gemmatimonadota bacterium]
MRRRAAAWVPAAVWAAVLFFASSRSTIPVDLATGLDKPAHFAAYLVLGLLLTHATVRSALSPVIALLLGAAYGLTDEIHQSTVPGRAAEFGDWAADTAGTAAGVLLYLYLCHRRQSSRDDDAHAALEST